MNPNAHQPSREDVLDAFAVEPSQGREILERYLREYPHFSNELVDLSRELSRVPDGAERPMSLQEQAMIDAAWQRHIPPAALEAGARAIGEETYVGNKETLRDAARAAFLAMLEAWPNKESLNKPSDWHRYVVLCISEKTDDKA